MDRSLETFQQMWCSFGKHGASERKGFYDAFLIERRDNYGVIHFKLYSVSPTLHFTSAH